MNVSVREAGPFERVVCFQLTDAEIDAAKTEAARRLSKDLKLKGFRPGRAPRPVVEAAVGADRLRSEAIEDAIPPVLTRVLADEDLAPAVTPELEKLENTEGGVAVEVKVTLWPSLESAPAFRDRRIQLESPEVTDEELASQLDRIREQFGEVEEVERPAADGDFVSVDIRATVDGVEMEEASATELLYRVGTGGLISEADDHLLGTSAGDEVSFDSELPAGEDDSGASTATFFVTVNEVKELVLPDLTDDWVDENTEYSSVDELSASMRQRMEEMKTSTLSRRFADRALETLLDQIEIDLPPAILRSEMDELFHRFSHRLEEQEISLQDYFEVSGVTQEAFLADLEAQANRSLRTRVLLDAVIVDADLSVGDEDIDAVLYSVANQTDDPLGFMRAVRGSPQELSLRGDMLRDKAIQTILENATAVDENGNVIDIDLGPQAPDDLASGEVVEGEVVQGEIVESQVVQGEITEGEVVESEVSDGDVVAGVPLDDDGTDEESE